MKVRLLKETRELLVVLIGTPLLIVVPFLLHGANAAPFGIVAFALGCLILGGWAFGNEFQHRTLALLLSQPVSRSVLWRDKMLVLGAGTGASLVVVVVCQFVFGTVAAHESPATLALVALCAFCGAPYWTLVLRHSIGGMAMAAGAPAALLALYVLVTEWFLADGDIRVSSGIVLIVLYCGAVLWRGYAQFERLEVFDSVARELTLPPRLESVLARPLAKVSSRFRGPFASLLKKELRLQQVSFLLAGVFFLVAVIGFCLFWSNRGLAEGIVGGDYGCYLIILPLVAGAIAVAEERGWGVAEWHLTLPPSSLQQWSAKMLATLTTSLTLGLVLPYVMFLSGAAVLTPYAPRASLIPPASGLVGAVLGQLLVTSVAVYAGSFSRNTLWAILTALAVLIASVFGFGLAPRAVQLVGPAPFQWVGYPYVVAAVIMPLLLLVLLFFMLCLTQWFAWSNFRRPGLPARRSAGQLIVVLLCAWLAAWVYWSAHFFLNGA